MTDTVVPVDEFAEEIYGSFLADGTKSDIGRCRYCEVPVPIASWTTAPHEPECIVNRAKAMLSATPTSAQPGGGEGKSRDWTEDFSHENGNYQNVCCKCASHFMGHKRRVICKQCAAPAPAVGELVARLREEAEFHCVGAHQGFSETDAAEERELMALLNEAASALERLAGEPVALRVSIYGMYDCHAFQKIEAKSVDEVIAKWLEHNANMDDAYGPTSLCHAIVLDGDRELRRVGKMVFPDEKTGAAKHPADIEKYRQALLNDRDIPRLLAHPSRPGGSE